MRASVISGEMEDICVYVNDGDGTVSSLLLLLFFEEDNREVELLSDLVIMVAA